MDFLNFFVLFLNCEILTLFFCFVKPVERETRKFNPLRIPKALEKDLPFAAKPKRMQNEEKMERPVLIGYENKKDKQVDHLLVQLGAIKEDKLRKAQIKKQENFVKRQKVLEEEKKKIEAKAKVARKRVFKLQGIEKEKAAKKQKISHAD